jgi:hypothetical protein
MKLANRNSLKALLLGVMSCAWLLTGHAQTVIFHLKNGDRISGTLVKEDANAVVLETGFGKLSLPVAQIERRDTPTKPPEAAKSPASAPTPAAPLSPAPLPPPPKLSFRERLLKNLHGQVQVGADLGFGTKERQLYSGRFQATYAKERWQNGVELNAAYGKTEEVLSANRVDGVMKTTLDLGKHKRLYAFNAAGAGYDEVRLIDLGFQEGAGLGYRLFNRSNLVAGLELGGQYHRYEYSNNTSKENYSVTFGETLTWNLTSKLILKEKALFSPDVRDFEDYRLRVDVNLSYPLSKNLTLNLNVIDLYDSQPPPGVEPNDLTVQAAVGWSF